MPELPDVEARKKYLQRTSLGKPIARVAVTDARVLGDVTAAALARGLKGARFIEATRRGKYLLVLTSRNSTLMMHFGMSGELFYRKKGGAKPRWSRVEYYFESGDCLHYVNMRLIGKVDLFDTADVQAIPDIAKLGPEPLSRGFTFEKFKGIVAGHETTIHQLLMDQELIAGIGNEFSDEITYQAGVRPDRGTSSLTGSEVRALYDKMKWTLRRAIELDADLDGHPDVFLIPNRVKNGECPRRNAKLVKKTIAGRSSYYCPVCQK
jgi:formamidopyrimidine-DNA glycosylase